MIVELKVTPKKSIKMSQKGGSVPKKVEQQTQFKIDYVHFIIEDKKLTCGLRKVLTTDAEDDTG